MIGYNVEEVNRLIASLNSSYKNLGQTMATGWPTVSSTLGTEWIGPDEVSFETALAARMCELYGSCRESISAMVTNIQKLGMSWQEFQNNNLITGTTAVKTLTFDVSGVALEDFDIKSVVTAAERTFSSGTQYGVTNGQESATNINTKVTEYVNAIGENVKAMYDQTSSGQAFLGAAQSDAIDTYLKNMADSFSKVVTQVTDMQQTLTQLVANYNAQMEALATTVSGIDTNISTSTESVQG